MNIDRTTMRFLGGFAILWSALYGLGQLGATSINHGVAAAVAIVALALVIETRGLGTAKAAAPSQLGLGRPAGRAMVAASVVSLGMLMVLPLYAVVANAHLQLRPGWPWLAVSLFAYHGVAEEVCWRGYAFGHLRRTRTFRAAVIATMPLIAITHVPIMIESGVAVGLAAIVVAAVTCIPLAHLYELGHRTIWAGALAHAAIDGFKLVDDPAQYAGLAGAVAGAALLIPFASLAWHRRPVQQTPALATSVFTIRKEEQ